MYYKRLLTAAALILLMAGAARIAEAHAEAVTARQEALLAQLVTTAHPESLAAIKPVAAHTEPWKPTATETPEAPGTSAPTPTPTPRTYNGITEGDIIIGEATHYDVCRRCCGKTDGVTASGQIIRNGEPDPHIVACNWLPFGSVLEVDGIAYTVADRGGDNLDSIGRLDVYTPEGHRKALELGRRRGVEIRIVKIGGEKW